ncbi:MAG TPA: hypothetical protein VEY33_07565 [Gemmatimonadota bacterium]|nr:hypothetical protein [Gemmatimonadota bacterium]
MSDQPKNRLHELIDELPDSEVDTAERILEVLRNAAADRFLRVVDAAPYDDEPDDDDFDGGLTEARSENSISHEEARRQVLGE